MAVLANNSEGSSVPPEMAQNLEVDDDYNKYTPSADYNSTSGRCIFRNKKFTKKRHESKSRRTDVPDDASNACGSDEDYPQASTSRQAEINVHGNLPTILSSINSTIQKMSIKDNVSSMPPALHGISGPVASTSKGSVEKCLGDMTLWRDNETGGSTTNLEVDDASQQQLLNQGMGATSSTNLQAQGKRRRHRRKQQYKRMAVDVQSEKKCVQLKVPTSNSSEDSGIGKRKRNLVPTDGNGLHGGAVIVARVPVPVVAAPGPSTSRKGTEPRVVWGMDCEDAIMMECDDGESNSHTKIVASDGMNVAEETGESDTQNDDIESLSDNNQDADDEESDYYNNDSSTTSLSESSFTVLNSSKKFIPVHSREIRSGRRRLKDNHLSSIENEEVSKFMQTPTDTVLKVYPSSDRERQEFVSIATRYSLTLEEGLETEDQRNWVQFTKTSKTTTTQRKNDMIKAAIGDRFTESSSLAAFLDTFGNEDGDGGEESDSCMDGGTGASVGNTLIRGALGTNQLVNSKRIKKGC